MGLIQPEAKTLWQMKPSGALCWITQCAVFHLEQDKSHEEEKVEINPFHPSISLQNTAGEANRYFLFFVSIYIFPSKKKNKPPKPTNQEKVIQIVVVTSTLKCFAGYGSVFTIFCSGRNCKYFVSITKTKLPIWCICFFPPLFTWSFLCSKGTVFLWITIFSCPGGISAISSRSNTAVHSSELEQCPYFVFHGYAWGDLGCSASFMFATGVLPKQVLSDTIVPDYQGAGAHRDSHLSSSQWPPKKSLNSGKAFNRCFPCRSRALPRALLLYSMLWRLYKMMEGLYDLLCCWQSLRKNPSPNF